MKKYDIFLVGSGKQIGWTQDSPCGPLYDEKGENVIDLVVHNPESTQLILNSSGQKVNALPRIE